MLSRIQKRFMDEILVTLEKILEQRKSATADNSYVASLYNQGTDKILDKISEAVSYTHLTLPTIYSV